MTTGGAESSGGASGWSGPPSARSPEALGLRFLQHLRGDRGEAKKALTSWVIEGSLRRRSMSPSLGGFPGGRTPS